MHDTKENFGERYYTAVGNKDLATVEKLLHPDVEFLGPADHLFGKEDVMKATTQYVNFFEKLTLRKAFESGDDSVVIYDVFFPDPIGKVRGAVLVTAKDGLVMKLELFYDTRHIHAAIEEIFG